jgi:hypothetical protein
MYVVLSSAVCDEESIIHSISQIAISRFTGLQLLRLSDATVLPFNTTHCAYKLGYSVEL